VNPDLLQGFFLRDFLVEPARGLVTGKPGSVHLPPKAMEVLLVLASNAGTLVTREALLEEVWGTGHGSQEALGHAVSEIRHALNDNAIDPQFIQTLPKRGYRLMVNAGLTSAHSSTVILRSGNGRIANDIGLFENLKQRGVLETAIAYLILGWLLIQIADIVFGQLLLPAWAGTFVTVLVIAGFPIAILLSWFLEFRDGRAVSHEISASDAVKRRFSRTYISVIGALAIAALFVFIYDRNIGLPEAPTVATYDDVVLPPILDNTIAVLPFMNLDKSDETQIFSNGLADDLITRLHRVPGLLVSSRGDSFTLDPNTASKKVRERLRVALYLEGSVQISGNKMRIIVQMIDSATGFHVMARPFDATREDFFDVRNEITELIVANIRVSLPADTQAVFQSHSDDPSIDLYTLYRRGIDASHEPTSADTIESALAWFDDALAIDPDYAAAHAGKCQVLVDAYVETKSIDLIDEAQISCANALSLNPNLDIAHVALGDLYRATGRYGDAENFYLSALRINRESVAALTGIGSNYMLQEKPDEAEARFRQAIGLQPGDWSTYNLLGLFLYRSGRYSEAAAEYRKVIALDNSNFRGFSNLGTAYMLAGDFKAAASALNTAIQIEPSAHTFSNLGLMYYYLGQSEEAIEAHQKAVALEPNEHLNWSNLGDALWNDGHTAEARQAFETAGVLVADALAVNPNDPNNLMDFAWISSMLDDNEKALALIHRALAQSSDDPYVHYIHGLILSRNGNENDAINALEIAAEKGYSLQMMAAEPHLKSLSSHRRFAAIFKSGTQ